MNVFDARLYFILFSRTLNERVNIKIITNGIINVPMYTTYSLHTYIQLHRNKNKTKRCKQPSTQSKVQIKP